MSQHRLEVVDEVAEVVVGDVDLAVCTGGRAPTEAPCPWLSKLPQYCR